MVPRSRQSLAFFPGELYEGQSPVRKIFPFLYPSYRAIDYIFEAAIRPFSATFFIDFFLFLLLFLYLFPLPNLYLSLSLPLLVLARVYEEEFEKKEGNPRTV